MKVIFFEPEHLEQIHLRYDREPYFNQFNLRELGELFKKNGVAYTGIDGGKVIGSAGVVQRWHGLGEAWAHISTDIKKYPISVTRAIKKYLKEQNQFHIIITYVRDSDEQAKKWAMVLGFKPVGTIHQYLPDKSDAVIFERVF